MSAHMNQSRIPVKGRSPMFTTSLKTTRSNRITVYLRSGGEANVMQYRPRKYTYLQSFVILNSIRRYLYYENRAVSLCISYVCVI